MFHLPHHSLMQLVQFLGYPGMFVIIFLESGVFFGFFLPGASILFTSGLMASQGLFNPWLLIPLVTIAAILGDNAGYWFGQHVGTRLFSRPNSRFFHQDHLVRSKIFYEKYGKQAVLIARFIPVVRTFAPIMAGIAHMKYRIFAYYNIIGAILWATGTTFLGYYLGHRFPLVQQYFTPIILGIIVVTTLPLFWELRAHRKTTTHDSSQ